MDAGSPQSAEIAVEVAAGLVFRENKLLIARRKPEAHLGGLWEFPGGKRRLDESFEACLKRELLEEVGIEVEVGALWEAVKHRYPDRVVSIRFFLCQWRRREPRALDCEAFAWAAPSELDRFEFPEADRRLLSRLKSF